MGNRLCAAAAFFVSFDEWAMSLSFCRSRVNCQRRNPARRRHDMAKVDDEKAIRGLMEIFIEGWNAAD
jgi:hypothetical protein